MSYPKIERREDGLYDVYADLGDKQPVATGLTWDDACQEELKRLPAPDFTDAETIERIDHGCGCV